MITTNKKQYLGSRYGKKGFFLFAQLVGEYFVQDTLRARAEQDQGRLSMDK